MSTTQNRTILITGVTRGIGRSMVAPLIAGGHTVIGCGRSSTEIGLLREAHATPHRFDAVDVADWSQVQTWARSVMENDGIPDTIINNAGIINSNAPIWEVSDEEFSAVLRVNVAGTANTIRAFLPAMIEHGAGIVINMSSGWGRVTAPGVAPYCASKWAIEGLTQAFAQELPPGLAAVAVNPGVIDTDMLRSCWGSTAASCPSPSDWADRAVPFLLSLNTSHNGESLTA